MKKLFRHATWGLNYWGNSAQEVAKEIGANESDLSCIQELSETDFILKDIPIEFKSVLSYMAYERGHSAGENEINLVLRGLVSDLTPAINEFKKNLTTTNNGVL